MLARDTMQVCENGHIITPTYHQSPTERTKRCSQCGAKTIHKCPTCETEIPGAEFLELGQLAPHEPPKHCANCGEPFPWARRQEAAEPSVEPVPIRVVQRLADRFHAVAKQLERRHNDRDTLVIQDEYDVQGLLHALLKIDFDDVRPEEYTPSYAGGSSRMDFLLKPEKLVVEVKKTGKRHDQKRIGDELLIDIARYEEHPDCEALFCFIYDPDREITNPRGLEKDLEAKSTGSLRVVVRVRPQ